MAKESKFNADSKLGFMLLFQICNICYILVGLVGLIFVTGYTVEFTLVSVNYVCGFLAAAITFWFVASRVCIARKGIIITKAIEIASLLITYSVAGNTMEEIIGYCMAPALWILYFATSRRAKAILVRPLDTQSIGEFQASKNRQMFDFKSKDFWLRILMYFFIFCVVGHWMEAGFCRLVNMGIMPGEITPENSTQFRDSLNPFPIYGIGFVACVLILQPLKMFCMKKFNNKFIPTFIVVYLVAMVLVGSAELIMGLMVNTDFSVWDYRNQPFNLMGQICLSYTAMFGVAASVVVWVVYPLLESLFARTNRTFFRAAFVVSLVLFVVLVCTYTIDSKETFGINSVDSAEIGLAASS